MKICTVSKLGNRIIYQVWGGDMSEFKKKKLQKLNLYVLARINENKNKEFEKAHYQKVKIYAEMLAKRRNLDVNRALVSAMLHDIGRIQPDSSKRKHAEVSAKIAYTILQNNGMKNNSSKKIAKDISKHSFKSQIGNPYEELLKDADSLAHQDEFGLQALSLPEKMRCELAEVCNMEFYLIPPDHMMWSDILWNKIKIVKEIAVCKEFIYQKDKIHEARIVLNQIRTLSGLLLKAGNKNASCLKEITEISRYIYRQNAQLRKMQIFLSIVPKNEDCNPFRTFLKQQIAEEEKKFNFDKFDSYLFKMPDREELFMEEESIKSVVEELIRELICQLGTTGSVEIQKLHRLRILAKKIQYIEEMKLIQVNPLISDSLKMIHTTIGDLHDSFEAITYLKGQKNRISKQVYKKVKQSLKEKQKQQKKQVEIARFTMNLLLSKYL